MVTIKDVTQFLDSIAPPSLQENYDNAGLIVGNIEQKVSGILVCLDSTEEIISEAISKKCNLVVAHHPIVFKGLKKITGKTYVERVIIKAIQNDVGIYAIHTNLDNIKLGVNQLISNLLELTGSKILLPKNDNLSKLVTFIPPENKKEVLQAIYEAGAGTIGNYSNCSFSVDGTGEFTPMSSSKPVIGTQGEHENVNEVRVEVLFETYRWRAIKKALDETHPYEEVAHYVTKIDNTNQETGAGMIGELKKPMERDLFLSYVKSKLKTGTIRYSLNGPKIIKKVAVCGGSGSFLISKARHAGADAFLTADIKYHDFFDGEDKLLIADIGHYESEVHTKDLLGNLLTKNFTTFAVNLSETDTNPIGYF
jgi:dinuclear metal center YbgI/SA1388 family protein